MMSGKRVKEEGLDNNLIELICADADFALDENDVRAHLDPHVYIGRCPEQVDEFVDAVSAETPSIISIFAGRIADTGVDPLPLMAESVKKAAAKPLCEVLWASTRELLNIYQAESVGCQIITVPNGILAKRKNVGKDLMEYSLDTVKGFARDIETLGFHILP